MPNGFSGAKNRRANRQQPVPRLEAQRPGGGDHCARKNCLDGDIGTGRGGKMKLPPDRFVAKKSFPHRQRVPAVKGADETTPAAVRWQDFTVGVFLILLVLAVFGQSARFDFVNYDDDQNVYANPVVARGLTLKGIGWAFTHAQVFNWIPLTTLSHMLDCQLFGQRGRTSSGQCAAARRDGGAAVFGVAADDRTAVAQRVCGGGVCHPSVAGRIGGLGVRAQGRVERLVFHAHPSGPMSGKARQPSRAGQCA